MALHMLHTVRRIVKELGPVLTVEPAWWLVSLLNIEMVLPPVPDGARRLDPLVFVYLLSPYAGALVGVFAKVFCSVQVGRRRVWSMALGGFLVLVILTDWLAAWRMAPALYGVASLIAGALGLLVGVGTYEVREVNDSPLFSPLFDLSKLTGRPAAGGEKRRKGPELRRFCARLFLFMVLPAALAGVSLLLAQKMSRIPHDDDDAIIVFLVLFLLFAILSAFSLVILARNITVSDMPTLLGRDDADDSEKNHD